MGVPAFGYGNNLSMPIFYPSARKKFRILRPLKTVTPFRFTCAMPHSNNLYTVKGVISGRRGIKIRG